MTKVDDYIPAYSLYSVNQKNYNEAYAVAKCKELPNIIKEEITNTKEWINKLEEVTTFMETEKVFYLLKDNDSNFGYVDKDGNSYQYQVINKCPVLIDAEFNVYKIIEYMDLQRITNNAMKHKYTITAWIDKVVRAIKIK